MNVSGIIWGSAVCLICVDVFPDFGKYVGVAVGLFGLLVALIGLVIWSCQKNEDHTPIIRVLTSDP